MIGNRGHGVTASFNREFRLALNTGLHGLGATLVAVNGGETSEKDDDGLGEGDCEVEEVIAVETVQREGGDRFVDEIERVESEDKPGVHNKRSRKVPLVREGVLEKRPLRNPGGLIGWHGGLRRPEPEQGEEKSNNVDTSVDSREPDEEIAGGPPFINGADAHDEGSDVPDGFDNPQHTLVNVADRAARVGIVRHHELREREREREAS